VKKSRFTEEQIAYALKQAETGTPVAEVLRRMGISEQTFYRWKKLYGGLGTGESTRKAICSSVNLLFFTAPLLPSGSYKIGNCQKSSDAWSAA
jgi:hypothetical protein